MQRTIASLPALPPGLLARFSSPLVRRLSNLSVGKKPLLRWPART